MAHNQSIKISKENRYGSEATSKQANKEASRLYNQYGIYRRFDDGSTSGVGSMNQLLEMNKSVETIYFDGAKWVIVLSKDVDGKNKHDKCRLIVARRSNGRKYYHGIITPRGINIGGYGYATASWDWNAS